MLSGIRHAIMCHSPVSVTGFSGLITNLFFIMSKIPNTTIQEYGF